MKVDVNQIPQEGLTVEEELSPQDLDLSIEGVSFIGPLKFKGDFTKVSGNVIAKADVVGALRLNCARCLKDVDTNLAKNFILSYPLSNTQTTIDLDEDIRQEVIVEYPVKSLCKPDCKGLCPGCGEDLNEGKCDCKS